MWMWAVVFLLGLKSGRSLTKTSKLQLTAADFYAKLQTGKMMFVYFEQQISSGASPFLEELEKSSEPLQDYAVLVGKVSCSAEPIRFYCTDEKLHHTAFLFRGGKEFLSFDLDTVFDVNSIIAEVLFAILRDEVKYVHTDGDLLAWERTARGKKNIVLSYVQSLGTAEHRSIMETAYVYGTKYQFILITGGPVLKHLGVNDSSLTSGVWFLHCALPSGFPAPVTSERCPLTRMRSGLSTLNLHSFLQLMEAPLLSEVYVDPSSVPPPQFPHQTTPQVFLFSRPPTHHLDMNTATALAWRLRGLALLLLVHRESPAVKTPAEYNAAVRLPGKSPAVEYLTLHSLDDLSDIVKDHTEQHQEEEEEEDEDLQFGKLYDEVAADVSENSHDLPDAVTQLTSDNFHGELARGGLMVVLFYLKWDAVSTAFLNSFVQVAEKLAESKVVGIRLGAADCGEWTDLCAAQLSASVPFQPITSFPSILLLRPHESAQPYQGMLGSEALYCHVVMSSIGSPVWLSTQQEVTSFLQEGAHVELAGCKLERMLGLFKTQTQTGFSVFLDATKSLRGEVLSGLTIDGLAEKWASAHATDLPAVLVFPSRTPRARTPAILVPSSSEELVRDIRAALRPTVPELTVENLPSLLSLGKALLLLFVGEEEDDVGRRQTRALVDELGTVVELGGAKMEPYLPCWIHLGHTPAGMSILGSYLGHMPPLPALVLTHLPAGGEVYQFPPSGVITASSVLQWLQRVEDGAESATGELGEDSWPPVADFYDFLRAMEAEDPESVEHRSPTEEEEVELEQDDPSVNEKTKDDSLDKKTVFHSEL